MILANVNIGTGPSAGDGDPLRSAFATINNNFQVVTNNVNALSNSVTSVAGRTGNVVLTVNDVIKVVAAGGGGYWYYHNKQKKMQEDMAISKLFITNKTKEIMDGRI